VLELRRLLYALKESRPDIYFRFRLMGEMWQPNFMGVLLFTETGVALNDRQTSKVHFISDLNNVMQFEIDQAFQQYQPHFHYSTDPAAVQ
jgi:hypothetical protein